MFSNSTSDETVLRLRRKWEVSERVIEPLEMSDTEIVSFIIEACKSVEWIGFVGRGEHYCGWLVIMLSGESFTARTMVDAIQKAAAYDREANGV